MCVFKRIFFSIFVVLAKRMLTSRPVYSQQRERLLVYTLEVIQLCMNPPASVQVSAMHCPLCGTFNNLLIFMASRLIIKKHSA
jgi:hypothetical protein